MRQSLRLFLLLVPVLLIAAVARADDPTFTLTTDRDPVSYQPGEPMKFSFQLFRNGAPAVGEHLTWVRRGDDQQKQTGEIVIGAEPAVITTSLNQPGFVRLTLTLVGQDGKPQKGERGWYLTYEGGAGVQPQKLQTVPEPKDFDAFWQMQKQRLAAVPMKSTLTPAAAKRDDVEVFDVQVDCAGDKPVSGYYSRPKDAKPGSLPAMVTFHGYGVRSAHVTEKPNMLVFDVNAHGIPNGKPAEFYKELRNGPLKRYGFSGNESAEDSYFLGMYMRVMRSLQFIKAQPQWDGKTLIVMGGSQGGMQAIAAAGLDGDVTLCMASKPWCCDLGGVTLGRQSGWRPDYTPALRYFDPAYHVKRTNAYVLVDCGLGDYTCPPSTVSAMFNNAPADRKAIYYIQGATHMFNPPGSVTLWAGYQHAMQSVKAKSQ